MSRPNAVWSTLLAQLGKEPRVAWVGLFGVTLGAVCALFGLARGFAVPPEGNLWETAIFNGSVGVFLLTQALLAPEAGFTERGQRRWGTALVIATLYAYGIETVQAFRGLDPRLSAVAGVPDQILGGVFFLDAVGIMALFLVLAWRFFRVEITAFRLDVRYAAVACLMSFGIGIWMSIFEGRMVGVEGNLLPIHAAGFHGLQAIPLVALLLVWGGAPDNITKRWVHVAGIAWWGFCGAILWQAAVGWGPSEGSPAMMATWVFFSGWALAALVALRAWSHQQQPVGG